jgi:hypothetical protein
VIDVAVWLILAGAAIALLLAIATGRMSGKGSNFAALTSFHDMQPKDRRDAVEVIVEKKAGKRWSSDESGNGTDDEKHNAMNNGTGTGTE